MKLLLDEMLSPTIARELAARGHDVIAVAGNPAHQALSDPDVLALARSQQRAVVTNNVRDFRPLHAEAVTAGGSGHYGIIFMPSSYRRTKADTGRIVTALESKLIELRAPTTSPTPRRGCRTPASALRRCANPPRGASATHPGRSTLRRATDAVGSRRVGGGSDRLQHRWSPARR